MAKKGKKKGTLNGQPCQPQVLPAEAPTSASLPEIGSDQGLGHSEPALEQEGVQTKAPAMQPGPAVDWLPFFVSAHRASDISTCLLLKEMGAMRGASRKVLSASQLFFDARWRRQFPCPWSAAAGGDPAEDGTPKDKEERQKQFSEKINALERAMGAMSNGDAKEFGEAAEALGPASLSQLDMASFCCNSNSRSLLHYAAIRCDLLAARWLLRHGASPNVKSYDTDCYGMNSTSWTPLHHAARNGDVAMCKVLLAAGADVHAELTDPEMKDYDYEFRSVHASGRLLYKQDVLGAGSTPADIARRIGKDPLAELLRNWPRGAPARVRPSCLAPKSVNMGPKVAAAVAKAIAQDPRPVVLRPRHRYCKLPGPLVPEANTTQAGHGD